MSSIKEILPKLGVNLFKMSYLIGQFQVRRVTALVSDFYEITFQLRLIEINIFSLISTDFDFDSSGIVNVSSSHSHKSAELFPKHHDGENQSVI